VPDVALLIDWENVYYTMRQHTEGPLPSTLSILQAILTKAASFGPVRVKLAIFGQEVSSQDDTLLMALEFTGIEPIAVAQRMSGRLLKGRSDAVLITRAMKLLYKDRPDIDTWFIVSGDRDLNALCKALKDEDKHVYLVAGDQSLANELRESPYLRDDVFLLEDLIPEARWTRTGLRADDTQADRLQDQLEARADVAGVSLQSSFSGARTNLDDVASILTTRTERSQLSIGVPVARVIGSRSFWLPALQYRTDRTHQYGDGIPANSGFSATHVPDQVSLNQAAQADWQIRKLTVGYSWNRSHQDNRQVGRESADLTVVRHALTSDG